MKIKKKITQSFAKFILIGSTKMLKQTLYVSLHDVDQYFANELYVCVVLNVILHDSFEMTCHLLHKVRVWTP